MGSHENGVDGENPPPPPVATYLLMQPRDLRRNKPFSGMSLGGQYYKTNGNKNFTVPQNGMFLVFIK